MVPYQSLLPFVINTTILLLSYQCTGSTVPNSVIQTQFLHCQTWVMRIQQQHDSMMLVDYIFKIVLLNAITRPGVSGVKLRHNTNNGFIDTNRFCSVGDSSRRCDTWLHLQ